MKRLLNRKKIYRKNKKNNLRKFDHLVNLQITHLLRKNMLFRKNTSLQRRKSLIMGITTTIIIIIVLIVDSTRTILLIIIGIIHFLSIMVIFNMFKIGQLIEILMIFNQISIENH